MRLWVVVAQPGTSRGRFWADSREPQAGETSMSPRVSTEAQNTRSALRGVQRGRPGPSSPQSLGFHTQKPYQGLALCTVSDPERNEASSATKFTNLCGQGKVCEREHTRVCVCVFMTLCVYLSLSSLPHANLTIQQNVEGPFRIYLRNTQRVGLCRRYSD